MENTKIFRQERCKIDFKQVVYLKEYIIYEQTESLDKYAIFKFYNSYHEKLNAIEFIIKQYDANDNIIVENVFKYSNFIAEKQEFFSPYTKMMVEDNCCRLEAVLVKADFEFHHFSDNKLISQRDLVNAERGLKPSRKERNKVKVKRMKNKNKIPYFVIGPILLVITVLLTLYFYNSVINYSNNLKEFSDNNFHYQVENGTATVDQYYGDSKDVKIVKELTVGTKKIAVTKIADNAFKNSDIETIKISAESISIGKNAFSGCKKLEKIEAETVVLVDDSAFLNCEVLEEFDADSIQTINANAFNNCKVLSGVSLSGTKEIKSNAFKNCSALTSVYGENVELVETGAFEGCTKIKLISLPKALIQKDVFSNEVKAKEVSFGKIEGSFGEIFGVDNSKLPEKIEKIVCNSTRVHVGLFENITAEIELSFINKDVAIEYLALRTYYESKYAEDYFYNNYFEIIAGEIVSANDYSSVDVSYSNLKEYEGEIASISPDAFAACTSLRTLTISIDGLHLESNTLSRADSVTSLYLTEKVTFAEDALEGCDSLETLKIHVDNGMSYQDLVSNSKVKYVEAYGQNIPSNSFKGMAEVESITLLNATSIGEGLFIGCEALKNVNMNSLTLYEIPAETFSGCKSLEYFNINYVEKIGDKAFKDCEKLVVDINSSKLTNVGAYAFYNCDSITMLNVGYNVNYIGDYAYAESDNLETVLFTQAMTLSHLGSNAFNNCKGLKEVHQIPSTVTYINETFSGENNIKVLTTYNLGIEISKYGDLDELEELTIYSSYTNNYLNSNLVNNLPKHKKLQLPNSSYLGSYVVNNCPNLEFIEFYVKDNSPVVSSSCSNLKYVTIHNSSNNFNYGAVNEAASATLSLYITGSINSLTSLSKATSLETLCVNNLSADHLGQVFGSSNYSSQKNYVPTTLKNVELGNSEINANFFNGCSSINNVVLLNANNIYSDALSNLTNLKNIYFGTTVRDYSFVDGLNKTSFNNGLPTVISESNANNYNMISKIHYSNSKTNNGVRRYTVYDKDSNVVGTYEHVFVYSIDEINSMFGLSGSLTFEKNSNTPAIIESFSNDKVLYSFDLQPFEFKAYEQVPVTVTYIVDGIVSKTEMFEFDGTYSLYVPYKNGNRFMGWYTDSSFINKFEIEENTTLTKDITLYAKFIDLNYYNVIEQNSIHSINSMSNHVITSDLYDSVKVFAYSNSSYNVAIYDENNQVVANLTDNSIYELELAPYKHYYVAVKSNYGDVYISYEFDGNSTLINEFKVDIDNEQSYTFKYEGDHLSGLVLPSYSGYEFLGWYDENGKLVIDSNGNIFSYKSGNLYAHWALAN